jgi:hypothetical protein
MRIFVTGPTGAGKTTTARQIAADNHLKFINYDDTYGYQNVCPDKCLAFLESLPDDCVVDTVPLDQPPSALYVPAFTTFNEWAVGADIRIICTVLPKAQWLQRRSVSRPNLNSELWDSFWMCLFPTLDFPVIDYINTPKDLSHDDAMKTIDMIGMIRNRITSAQKGYDARYQDIPEIGLKGYERSAQSWQIIKGLVDWEYLNETTIVDCGCFHGYTLFRIDDLETRSPLIGLDFLDAPLETARAINKLRDGLVDFRKWDAGDPLPECVGVTLCLNALHHFPDPQKFFDTIHSEMTIFEVDREYEPAIKNHWTRVESFPSPRPDRLIYRCIK